MAEGAILNSIEGRSCGLDDHGNLVLNSATAPAGTPARGYAGIVGPGIPSKVGISNAAGGTQYYSLVTFQVQDALGSAVSAVFNLDVFLSDASTGIGLTGTTASGGIADGASGKTLSIMTSAKALRVQTDATGKYILQIIDSSKTTFYPCANLAGQGVTVGAQLTAASYHA